MSRTRWRDRPPIVERPSEWGTYAVMSTAVGLSAAAVFGSIFVTQLGGVERLGWAGIIGIVLVGGFIAFWCVVLVVLVAVGFARVAQGARNNLVRFAIIAGGVALSLTLVTAGPLALAGYSLDALLPFALAAALPGIFLGAGATMPWRYGFARPSRTTPTDAPGVP